MKKEHTTKNPLKKLSLQWRLTLIITLLMTVTCVLMYFFISNSAVTGIENLGDYVVKINETDSTPITFNINPNTLFAGLSDQVQETKDLFRTRSIIATAIIILLSSVGTYFISRRALLPLRRLSNEVNKIEAQNLSESLEVPDTNDEISRLTGSFNKMLSRLDDAFTAQKQFSASAAHELRTPLTAIRGWTETVTSMYEDKETFKKGMRVITSETERLSQMVEELLDFSRIQDNRLTLIMDTIDILAELGETVLIYQERAKALGITLNYYEPKMLPFVYGDKNRLRQVFINIVDNAIKYSNKGDTVSVEAYEEDNEVCISISDTGMGISKDDLPKVKTKFFKANHTRRGSGIGLAVADEIIQRHGGTLEINSEQGVGTTVMITLPCIEQKKKPDNQATVDVELISSEPIENNDNVQ